MDHAFVRLMGSFLFALLPKEGSEGPVQGAEAGESWEEVNLTP